MSIRLISSALTVALAFGLGAYAQDDDKTPGKSDQSPSAQPSSPTNPSEVTRPDQSQSQSRTQSQSQDREDRELGQLTAESFLQKLHADNVKEIHLATQAQSKSENNEVDEYANMLIRDHRQADEKVRQIASAKNVTLKSDSEILGEKMSRSATGAERSGQKTSSDQSRPSQSQTSPDSSQSTQSQSSQSPSSRSQSAQSQTGADSSQARSSAQQSQTAQQRERDADAQHEREMARLETLSGQEFDREYTMMMSRDHQKLLQTLQRARTQIDDAQVKGLIDQLEPTVRQHAERAVTLAREFGGNPEQGTSANK